jgi:hypothetical protein
MLDFLRGERVMMLAQLRLIVLTAFLNALVVPVVYFIVLVIERVTPSRVS